MRYSLLLQKLEKFGYGQIGRFKYFLWIGFDDFSSVLFWCDCHLDYNLIYLTD